MSNNMRRGKMQVMYNFPPGATFSNPKHNLIEKAGVMYGEQMELTSEQEMINYVHASLENWDGGVEGTLPPPVPDRWAIIDPKNVYSEIFPRVFECMKCKKVHDYSGNRISQLENNGLDCQRHGCGGTLTQIHHVGVCSSCSHLSSIYVPRCEEHGYDYVKLDDRSDRYKDFNWRCGACNNRVLPEDFQTFCGDCKNRMDITVHSSSKALNIHDVTRVDLGSQNIYQSNLHSEDEIDPLVIGAYLGEFDHPETTLREMVQKDGISQIDPDRVDTDDPEVIEAAKQMLGQVGGEEDPGLVRAAVQKKVGSVEPSDNMRRYIQLHEIMDQESAREKATPREDQLMDQMGIYDIGVTSEFPLVKAVFGYHRTFEDQEEEGPTPSVRMFPNVQVEEGDWRQPIYANRSKTEAAIVQLDPRDVGHWLSEAGYDIKDTSNMDVSDARATLFAAMEPIEPYSTDLGVDSQYNSVTLAVHRLLHTMSHLLIQRASVHSGIEETSFAEYLFTEALATAIYANNTQNYTAGGLFTLIDRNLDDWLLSTLRQGERCMYDSSCAEIDGGACHACLHMSEVGCQHFNKNLSRIELYGERIATKAPAGFWKLTGGLGSTTQ